MGSYVPLAKTQTKKVALLHLSVLLLTTNLSSEIDTVRSTASALVGMQMASFQGGESLAEQEAIFGTDVLLLEFFCYLFIFLLLMYVVLKPS